MTQRPGPSLIISHTRRLGQVVQVDQTVNKERRTYNYRETHDYISQFRPQTSNKINSFPHPPENTQLVLPSPQKEPPSQPSLLLLRPPLPNSPSRPLAISSHGQPHIANPETPLTNPTRPTIHLTHLHLHRYTNPSSHHSPTSNNQSLPSLYAFLFHFGYN